MEKYQILKDLIAFKTIKDEQNRELIDYIESVLRRGFVWVRDNEANTIYSVKQAQEAQNMKISFADGMIDVSVNGRNVTAVKKNRKVIEDENLQTDLFDM